MKIRTRNEEQQTDMTKPVTQAADSEKSSPPYFTGDTPVQCRFSGDTVTQRHSLNAATSAPQLNRTGMSDGLKSGLERLSGFDLSPVRVHYNSPKPTQVGALAYAQGTNIHLGPGQEKHLPHEGWHVVQQLQGRVVPTMQQKGARVNDSDILEREADVMGAAALQAGGGVNSPAAAPLAPVQKVVAPVVQRRIPEMTLQYIRANRDIAVEILAHAINNMDQHEFLDVIFSTSHPHWWDYDEIVNTLQDASPEAVYEWYQLIYEKTGEEKRYQPEVAEQPVSSSLQTSHINQQVGSNVLPALGNMHGNTDLHIRIFGPECDSNYIDGVLVAIDKALDAHIVYKSCPLQISGNKEHNEWVGVAGATSKGAKVVSLGRGGFNGVLKGSARGLATLVHEFSHAAAGTKDHAYSIASLANLTTLKRMTNAETYAQAFLECLGPPDTARYYDPGKVVDTGKGHSEGKSNIGQRLAGTNELMVDLWNNVDNAYNTAELLKNNQELPLNVRPVMYQSVLAAIYPHRPSPPVNLDVVMALIEDRTKVLKTFMSKSTMRKTLMAKGVKRSQMEAEISGDRREYVDLAALAMAEHFNLSVQVTVQFLSEALQIPVYSQQVVEMIKKSQQSVSESSPEIVSTSKTSSLPPPNDEI